VSPVFRRGHFYQGAPPGFVASKEAYPSRHFPQTQIESLVRGIDYPLPVLPVVFLPQLKFMNIEKYQGQQKQNKFTTPTLNRNSTPSNKMFPPGKSIAKKRAKK